MGAQDLAFVGLAGSTLGTALAIPMVWPGSRRALDVRLLGLGVLMMAALGAVISARLAGLAPSSAAIEHTINLLGLTAAPALLGYTRHATNARIGGRDVAVGWMPALVYILILSVRAAAGQGTRVPFVWLLPVLLAFTVASIVTLVVRAHERRPTAIPAEWVVGFVVVLNIAQIVRMEFRSIDLVRALVPLVLSTAFLTLAAFVAWRALRVADERVPPPSATSTPVARYERSGLDDEDAAALLTRIHECLSRGRLFACADLTLAQLAEAAGATPHHVSEVLNRLDGGSFTEAVNRRRVEDVKVQLLDADSERFTIEGIGASAGFGSRSALYAAFRRYEGMTPSAFRAAARATAAGVSRDEAR